MSRALKAATRLGFLAGLFMLSACANESGGAPQQEGQSAATTSTQAATAPGQAVKMPDCSPPAQGRVAFRVGDAVLRVPGPAIENVIPSDIQSPLQGEALIQAVQERVARGEGCPATPMDSRILLVKTQASAPQLQPGIGFRAINDNFLEQYAKLTATLRNEPDGRCQRTDAGLLACRGAETNGGRETQVVYFIHPEPSVRMISGAPLFARCVVTDNRAGPCAMFDRLGSGALFETRLIPGEFTADGLKAIQQDVLGQLRLLQG